MFRLCSLKLQYSKATWSLVGFADMLAPVAKIQLTGERLVIGMPFESLMASLKARSIDTPPSFVSLTEEILKMTPDDFEAAGGFGAHLVPGQFMWIPPSSLVAEFNISGELCRFHNIQTTMHWVAMTKHCLTQESVLAAIHNIDRLKALCCDPSQKPFETMLQARWIFSFMFEVRLLKLVRE